MTHLKRVFLAEDDQVTALIIQDILENNGYQVRPFSDGVTAAEHLREQGKTYDVILLDRDLPGMDGIQLLHLIKADPEMAFTPVVMETAMDDLLSIREGLSAGAYYYLTKPFLAEVLLAIVEAAFAQVYMRREMLESVQRAERPLVLLRAGEFEFKTLDEARMLAFYLAKACPDPERAAQGLQELLVNAVEHGNLGITYKEKSTLLKGNQWLAEVERRLQLPVYQNRSVKVEIHRQDGAVQFTISDQGDGFAWQNYLEMSPERAFDLHGRGIAMAHMCSFDYLQYQDKGNVVVARVNRPHEANA
jgi:DNA-binding response OmpR family regulator